MKGGGAAAGGEWQLPLSVDDRGLVALWRWQTSICIDHGWLSTPVVSLVAVNIIQGSTIKPFPGCGEVEADVITNRSNQGSSNVGTTV